jgi:hypothetical protein
MPCYYSVCGDHCNGVCNPFPSSGPRPKRAPLVSDDPSFYKEMKLVERRTDTLFIVSYRDSLYYGNSSAGYRIVES